MPVNIGSLQFDATINLDSIAKQTAEGVNKQIQEGIKTGTAAVKAQEEVIFEMIDTYKQLGATVAKNYDISKESFSKLTDAEIARQTDFFKMVEARGEALSKEQKEWLDMAEERRQKTLQEVEIARNRRLGTESSTPVTPGAGPAANINLGADFNGTLGEAFQTLADLDKTTQSYYNRLAQVEQRLTEVKAAQKALNQENSNGKLTADQYTKAYASLAAQEEMLVSTIEVMTQAQKAHEAASLVENGTIAQKKQLLQQLKQQWDEVVTAEFKTSEAGKAMQQNIHNLKVEIDALSFNNLDQSGYKATARLEQIRNQLATMKPGDLGYDKLIDEATTLRNRINNVNAEINLAGSNTAGLKAATSAVQGLIGGFTALQGAIGLVSDNDKELQKTLLVVTSSMSILNGVNEFASAVAKEGGLNQYLLSKFMKGTSVAATEQAAVTEVLTATQAQNAATTASNTAATVAGAAAAQTMAVAEGEQAVATEAAVVATEQLNAVMLSNPAAVIIIALTALVGAIYAFASASKNGIERQKELNEAMAEAEEILVKLAGLYTEHFKNAAQAAENAVSLAQAQGKSELQILDLRKQALEAKKQENLAVLATYGYTGAITDEVRKQIDFKRRELENINEQIRSYTLAHKGVQDLSTEDQNRLDLLQSQAKILATQYNAAHSAFEDAKKNISELANLNAETNKKVFDNQIKSDADAAQAQLTLARKNTKAELDAKIQAIETQRKLELNNPNLTKGTTDSINAKADKAISDAQRQYSILLLNNEKSILQDRLNLIEKGSQEELNLRKQINDKQASIDQKAEGITAEKAREIRSGVRKANEDLDRQFRIKQLNDQKSDIKTQLDVVKEGTAKELNLKEAMVNKQLEIDLAAEGLSKQRKEELTADAEKAISELRKKYALENKEIVISTRISEIQTDLSNVEKGSEAELQLKKDLIDQKAALDMVASVARIKNESQLFAKLKEIASKAALDKRKEDNDYADKKYQNDLNRIALDSEKLQAPFDKILKDPTSSAAEKYNAQIQKIQVKIKGLADSAARAQAQIIAGKGDIEKARQDLEKFNKLINESIQEETNIKWSRFITQLKQVSNDINKISAAFKNLSSAIQEVNPGLADTLAVMGEIGNISSDLIGSFASFSAGDIVGGVTGAMSAITGILSIGAKARESELKAREQLLQFQMQVLAGEIETNIQYRERLRIQVQINKTKLEGLRAEADLLAKQRQESLTEYSRIFALLQKESFVAGEHAEKYGGFLGIGQKTRVVQDLASLAGKSFDDLQKLFISGQLTDSAKGLFTQLQKLKQEGADIDQQLLDIKRQAQELYTGTTSDSILDGIIDGFKNGLHSASDFANNFEDLMRKAVLNSLKYKYLEKPLQDFYEEFAKLSESGDILTSAEIDKLRNDYNDIIGRAAAQFDQLQKITNLSLTGSGAEANSLKGSIKGITEQQAELLAGQFGAQRLTLIDILQNNVRMLDQLNQIVNNTSYIVQSHSILRDFQINGLKIK